MPPVDPGPRALPHAGLAHAALARRGGPRSETERPARAGLAEHGFLLTALFAFFEYGRPQDFFGVIDVLHPNLVLSVALVGCLLTDSQRVQRVASKTVLLTLLVGYLVVWVPFAVNNFWAFQIARLTLLLLIFFVAFVTFVDTSEKLERFIGVWLAALALQAVWGLTHAGMGTGGFLGDENDLALALNIGFPFALYGVLRSRGSRRLFFLACVGLLLAGVVASKSRGGFVGLVATAGMILLVSRRRLAILALVAVGAGLLALLAPRSYWTEIETIFDTQDETRVERVAMWEAAERAFRDNPVFGVGPGNINWRLVEYEVPDPSRPSFAGRAIHSLYWTLLPELGLVGVALYGALFAVTGREILRIRKRSGGGSPSALDFQARAILCALIAYLVCGVFLSVLYYPHLTYLMAMSTAADRIGARGSRS